MRKWQSYPCLALLLLSLACEKEEPSNKGPFPQPTPSRESPYPQYGQPFATVPKADEVVMYEVNLRAFSAAGDLDGVTARLDSIAALGVNTLWLMPIHPIGQVKSKNSPYSIRDYKAVNPELGDLDDLRALVDGAHDRGMAVMLDFVGNHTAWDHPWINDKPHWYSRDGQGNIIHPPGTNWYDVADLNFDEDSLQAALLDVMLYWLYVANVDGYRCDYADGVPFEFWQMAIDSLNRLPGRTVLMLAEGARPDHFQAGFDLSFGWQFYSALKAAFGGESASRIYHAHNQEYQVTPPGKHWLRFTSNHDESAWDATPMRIFNGQDGALAASAIAVFLGGAPLIYGSQEVGREANLPFFSRDPINWSARPQMREAYTTMLNFYAGSAAAQRGDLHYYFHPEVVHLNRKLGADELMVVVNLRNRSVDYTWPQNLTPLSQWRDALSGQPLPGNNRLNLGPYDYLILIPS